ncbi:bifunctional DNA-formamidopyrimidine glycosylase/DNA-(apurinic or apyrimidinic site) lyase [Propionicicella superfundia]|uniref:bifunctional DNA-formamidopyrimidine glycosylase/DNA-(apurinic or apyrimidinic site) lyase n=1 Tax=Propionicicella superfundia TaxID=348582 RepID=UPI0004192DEB|nr:bifunctional DNA-formamidopyrimidine glycosylase/DNA-(apurinic or apyrimidinic site) lyase [Propionicicella superfundia]
MPELPEVETIRRGLAAHVTGRTITAVDVLHPRPVRSHPAGPDGFALDLTGRTFGVPARRGKYLWLPFTDGDALLVELRMSGQFRLDTPAAPLPPHARVLFALNDGRELRYVDQRMLGGLTLSRGGAVLPREVAHIARDPFDPRFDVHATAAAMRRRRSAVKAVLLNQQVVSGIGNIYADETLWRARLHHLRPAAELGPRVAVSLLRHAGDVMSEALAAGGTSFDSLYVNVNGSSGYFAHSLNVYGRGGEACPRCGAPIERVPFGGRSSHFCPRCQRRR